MTGIIDVGGGLRGIFGAGVFDRCIDDNISFDCCIGVSAGGANIASFLGGQKYRNYRFYCVYAARKSYMSFNNIVHNGAYLDLDYVYGSLSDDGGDDPLNYEKLSQYSGKLFFTATDAKTGKAVYFEKKDLSQNDYSVLKASCALPLVCKSYTVNKIKCYDGGIADPVPVQKALDEGCTRLVLILTRPIGENVGGFADDAVAGVLQKNSPVISKAIKLRRELYKNSVEQALKLQAEGKLLILAPNELNGIKTLTRDRKKLHGLYEKGYDEGKKIKDFLLNNK